MNNHKLKVGDRVEYTGRDGGYADERMIGKRDTVVFTYDDRHNVDVDWDDRKPRAGVLPGNLGLIFASAPVDKLQQLLEEVRNARAAEHEARKAVAAAKASVKPAEAAYVEAQRTRQQAMERLLSAMDEAAV